MLKRPFHLFTCLMLILCLLPAGEALASAPAGAGPRVLEGGQRDLKWPVPGAYNLSSCYYDNRNHCALDIAADEGLSVIASYAGTVTAVYSGCSHNYGKYSSCGCGGGYGNYVLVEHSYILKNGSSITLFTRYAHLGKVSVSVGQAVSAGTKVGTVGSTGNSTGFHLHYETRKDGSGKSNSLDPFVNELLEMPDELYTTFGGCCKKYVDYVKELYPRCPHDSYNAQGNCNACGYNYNWSATRNTASMGHYTVSSALSAVKIPYTGAESVADLSQGDKVEVNATVTNGLGKIWYEVSLPGGAVGYVPKASLSFADYFDSEFQGSLTSLTEGQILKQKSHRVDGFVRSRYPLRSVKGYLDGACYATWTGSGSATELSFGSSVINSKLKFSNLVPGKHVFTLTATDSTGRGETQVLQCTFYIEQPPTVYTVTFSGETEETRQVQENKPLGELPAPSREGHRFLGWFTDAEAGDAVTADTVVTQSITLYPHWEAITYSVTLGETTLTVAHGKFIESFPDLTLEGHALAGWFTEEAGGTAVTNQTPITQDMVLFPQWTPVEYTLTLEPGNGQPAFQQSVTFGEAYGQLPTPTQEGFRFMGWMLDGTLITEATPVTATENHKLTAQWEVLPTEPLPTQPTSRPEPEPESDRAPSPLWLIPASIAVIGSGCVLLLRGLDRRRAKKAMSAEKENVPV